MTTFVLETKGDVGRVCNVIARRALPMTITVEAGGPRDQRDTRKQFLWYREGAKQGPPGHSAEWWRGYCKLTFGVAILRMENERWRETYDRIIAPLAYESQLELMRLPINFPVTREMTDPQFKRYLVDIAAFFRELGVELPALNSQRRT